MIPPRIVEEARSASRLRKRGHSLMFDLVTSAERVAASYRAGEASPSTERYRLVRLAGLCLERAHEIDHALGRCTECSGSDVKRSDRR